MLSICDLQCAEDARSESGLQRGCSLHLKATAWRLRHVLGLSLSFPAASPTLSILHPTAAMAAVIARWLCNPRKSRSTTASFQVSGRWVEVLFGLGAQCYDLPIAEEIIPDPFRHGSYVRRPCFVTGDIPPRGLDKRFSLVEGCWAQPSTRLVHASKSRPTEPNRVARPDRLTQPSPSARVLSG